jgi:hypothetical protein
MSPVVLLLSLLPLTATDPEVEDTPAIPIGSLEIRAGNSIKEGLITITSPTEGLTSFHLFQDSKSGTIMYGDQKREITSVRQKRNPTNIGKLEELYSDICIVKWDTPLKLPYKELAVPSRRHPVPDERVYIAKTINGSIVWEKKHIVGLEEFAVWTNLPKKAYAIILYLNNRPASTGEKFKEGDSGGGWISENGELLAITSRVVNRDFGPSKQIIYGTLVNGEPSPKKTGEKGGLARTPLLISIFILLITTVLILTKKRIALKKKIN